MTQTVKINMGNSGPMNNGNERVLRISQNPELPGFHLIVSCYIHVPRWGWVLSHCRDAVCIFCSLSKLSCIIQDNHLICHLFQFIVGMGCCIYQLHLCRWITPQQRVSGFITLNNLMRLHLCSIFGKCGAPLHCHRSQVHSDLEW